MSEIFLPGKFYIDPVAEITYLCVFEDVIKHRIEFVYYEDEENEFDLVKLPTYDTEYFQLKTEQDWD